MPVLCLTFANSFTEWGIDMGIVTEMWKLSESRAYETAVWNGKTIKVEVVEEHRTSRANNGNLIADEGRITLKTRFVEPYGINDVVLFRGKKYVIEDTNDGTYENVPQNTAIVKADTIKEITLYLFEVNSNTRNIPCATPVITVSGTTATITCDTEYATIYYTTNGTRPSSVSMKYTAPFDIGTAEKIYAIAVQPNYMPSALGAWSL